MTMCTPHDGRAVAASKVRTIPSPRRSTILATGAGAAFALVSALQADAVLDRYLTSLTSYRATAATTSQGVRPNVVDRAVNIDGGANWPTAMATGGPGSVPGLNPGSPVDPGHGNPGEFEGDPPSGGGGGSCGGGGGPPHIGVITPPQLASGAPPAQMGDISLVTGSPCFEEIDLAALARLRVARGPQLQAPPNGPPAARAQLRRVPGAQLVPVVGAGDRLPERDRRRDDMVYVVWGADRVHGVPRGLGTSNVFKAKNGANAAIESPRPARPDTWVLTGQTA